MKKIVCIFIILAAFLASSQKALAYGGGGGFPPVLGPLPSYKLECEFITRNLPYGWFLRIPNCKVVKVTEEVQNRNFVERFNDFVNRVRNGRP